MGRVVVGRIVKAFGVRGDVVVAPMGEDPDRFAPDSVLYGAAEGGREFLIESSRLQSDRLVVRFRGIDDRNEAEAMRNVVLFQDEEALPELPDGEFYHFQLIGLRVVREDESELGRIVRVHELPTSDVFEVQGPENEWMIPRTEEFVSGIDVEAGVVHLSARDDLLEAVGQARSQKESPGKIRRKAREEARRKAKERSAKEADASKSAEVPKTRNSSDGDAFEGTPTDPGPGSIRRSRGKRAGKLETEHGV